jgi:hypothetical protein
MPDSPLEESGFKPSVPRKPVPALAYSVLILKSLSAADSAPQTSPLRPASWRALTAFTETAEPEEVLDFRKARRPRKPGAKGSSSSGRGIQGRVEHQSGRGSSQFDRNIPRKKMRCVKHLTTSPANLVDNCRRNQARAAVQRFRRISRGNVIRRVARSAQIPRSPASTASSPSPSASIHPTKHYTRSLELAFASSLIANPSLRLDAKQKATLQRI